MWLHLRCHYECDVNTQHSFTSLELSLHVLGDGWVTKNDSDEWNGDEQNDDVKYNEEESGDARIEG